MPAQHHAQDVMRAGESDRWAVRATNTGYSGIIDPTAEPSGYLDLTNCTGNDLPATDADFIRTLGLVDAVIGFGYDCLVDQCWD